METTKENVLFLLACAWLVLMHLAKHVTRCRNALCFRPFQQLNLLISFLTSVLNLTYIFFSVLSLRQNSLLQSSLQLSYLHSRSFFFFFMNFYLFCWLYIHWCEFLCADKAQNTFNFFPPQYSKGAPAFPTWNLKILRRILL